MNKKPKVSESAETSAVRREQIVRELRRNGVVDVDALAARHSTSSSTIRRNYGFLSVLGVPYEPLVRAARETNQRLDQLVFGLTKPSQACQG